MSDFAASMTRFEAWLASRLAGELVIEDLAEKHCKMRCSSFAFLRATYWRWAETIAEICPDLSAAPELLAIGDTHLENFGTWRDAEGRLIWGVNDFDEAARMPYALDIVRLAASALLAKAAKGGPGTGAICRAILRGYEKGIDEPQPTVLERDHKWLRKAVMLPEGERKKFWGKLHDLKPATEPIGQRFDDALRQAMPDPSMEMTFARRTAGLGSLGRPRFVAMADWRGGPVVREAKALLPSAWSFARDGEAAPILAGAIAAGRCRAPDPHYRVLDGVVVRRLSPNSRKLDSKDDLDDLLSEAMLERMGREIAACHADDPAILPAVCSDLAGRGRGWLRHAAEAAATFVAGEHAGFA